MIVKAGKYKICRIDQQAGNLRWVDVSAQVWSKWAGRIPSFSEKGSVLKDFSWLDEAPHHGVKSSLLKVYQLKC
jgi:hypothetical protein